VDRTVVDISPSERDEFRVRFYRAHRDQPELSSVVVRFDVGRHCYFLDVGATGPTHLDPTYGSLAVRVRETPGAINAV
jgi:hypothetical protein